MVENRRLQKMLQNTLLRIERLEAEKNMRQTIAALPQDRVTTKLDTPDATREVTPNARDELLNNASEAGHPQR